MMNHREEKGLLTGYPSIDKPWLKYYSEEAIHAPLPEMTLYEYLYENNKAYPEEYALNYFGKKVSYGELFLQIDIVAKAFQGIGVKAGEAVTIVTVSCVTSVLCFYSLNRIGAISNYVNVLSTEEELAGYFSDAESKTVVTLDLFAEKVLVASEKSAVKQVIVFSMTEGMPTSVALGYHLKTGMGKNGFKKNKKVVLWKDFCKTGERSGVEISYQKDPHTVCCYAHTGGTTGVSKTVELSDVAMNIVAKDFKNSMLHKRGQIWLDIMIPFVVYGLLVCMHVPLTIGFETVLIPKFDSNEWAKYMKTFHPNYILGVPAYFLALLDIKKFSNINLSSLYCVSAGGDGLNRTSEIELNQFYKEHGAGVEMLKGYGMTEVCAAAVCGFNGVNKIGSVGIPLPSNNMMICETGTGRELPYNEVGEVCLQCPSRMLGYRNPIVQEDELFQIHEEGEEWLHTGDLGYIDEDGFLFLTGRIKRIILTTGNGNAYKVFPNVPEKVISEYEGVQEVCIVGANQGNDQVLRAVIVLKEEYRSLSEKTEKSLRKWCSERLANHMQPAYYEFIEKMPLTAAGKVDYRKLEELVEK